MRSLLYIPGNHPGMLQNCAIYGSDAVIFDLEDAISISEKDSARKLVKHALKGFDYGNIGVIVRVNGRDTSYFEADLEEIVPANPDAIRLPKVDSAEDVLAADELISRLEEANGLPRGRIGIQAMLETARAIVNVNSIAAASPRLVGLTLGGQDLAADLGIRATKEGYELLYAKSAVVIAAKAHGLQAFDTVFTDVNDAEGLREQAAVGFALGFSGKAAIHPSQIPVINAVYTPEPNEVAKAAKIVAAAKEAERRGLGVTAVDGRMVDAPVVTQALRTLELARLAGMEVPEL
jgi:citrate lyase subunit beta/citryl-CoA lyase